MSTFADRVAQYGVGGGNREPLAPDDPRISPRVPVQQDLRLAMFRILVNPTGTTTSTTTSTTTPPPGSTTTTTTTSTSSTTAPPCRARVHVGRMVDCQYDQSALSGINQAELRPLVVVERDTTAWALYSTGAINLVTDDIVMCARINGQWWVLAVYCNCPAGKVTTTTTTTTTTTSTTTPPPRDPIRGPT